MRVRVESFFSGLGVVGIGFCVACADDPTLLSPLDAETSAAGTDPSASGGANSGPGLTSQQNQPTTATTSKSNGTSGSLPISANSAVLSNSVATTNSAAPSGTGTNTGAGNDQSSGAQIATDEQTSEPTAGGTPGAIEALTEYLGIPPEERPALAAQSFAQAPLSAAQAEQAQTLLWADHTAHIAATRQAEHGAKVVTIDDKTLKYDFTVFGEPTATGRSLVLSLHGGGEAEASVNDEQWENQKGLYTLDEGIYLAPRAPTNTWNLWHETHIDPLFERLIENFIVLEGVDPNRVYVMGYSAGGDGVYQLGPRMADHWAAASAMAGHPNEAKPFSLRNIGFTIHVGAEDTAFDRNLVAGQWRDDLDALQAADVNGYEHVVEVHAGKAHWMDLEDAVAVPWMAEFTRNPVPERVVWYQDDILHSRFYWLHAIEPLKETTIVAELIGQTVVLESDDVSQIGVRLRDDMLDLDQPVTITVNGQTAFEGVLPRTIATLHSTLSERGDPTLVFAAETVVEL